ncbi:hypothetical protein PF008_g9944 [Phytophthora fragariae]|uniref:Uncharacterized protein n=1 Tax=Phytophthora fragariae TaxID=53985 RepID=A0A6G0RVC0_9STRA|nr:hypothetical protein PF008_g9944 [Phytophthora fragariae]
MRARPLCSVALRCAYAWHVPQRICPGSVRTKTDALCSALLESWSTCTSKQDS